jgi:N-methylhydantoinase B/oxoprolinase/acetone carboxylase alpha subunit
MPPSPCSPSGGGAGPGSSSPRPPSPCSRSGGAGEPGRNLLIPSPSQGEGQGEGPIELPSKGEVKVQPGDRLTLETPGGGGWGTPP